jgi:hypothetical protein
MPVNAMLPLDPQAALRFARWLCGGMGYPDALVDAVSRLLGAEPGRRPSPVTVMHDLRKTLAGLPVDDLPVSHLRGAVVPADNAAGELFRYIADRAAHARPDRYVPADPQVFERHPWGVAYGAAGILHAYQRSGRPAPDGLLDYLVAGARSGEDRGSDLMHGDAGIAWTLFDAGEHELAVRLLRASSVDGPIRERPGLHDGLAGWGLARLAAWRQTRDATFLSEAVAAGEALLVSGPAVDGKRGWHAGDTYQPVGLGQGATGVALFLLHLSLATGKVRYLDAGREALAFDLDHHGVNADGERTWRREVDGMALLPYLRHGTAGVLAIVARFLIVTGEDTYRDILLASEPDLMRGHAISPGVADGLAGIGETLLDLARALPDRASHYLAQAHRIAAGIEPFLVRRPGGLVVPGTELLRFSCDLATGNAGVAAFFDRLWHGGPASFMLDDHLPVRTARREPVLA